MGYRNLSACVSDLERSGQLLRIGEELDANLEVGAVQRRVYQAGGPALLFENVKGCRFPMLGNLFGTLERTRYLFRDALPVIERFVALKLDPRELLKHPGKSLSALPAARFLLPKVVRSAPVLENRTQLSGLPQLVSWPNDGGAFVTLPQVYSESPKASGWRHSNLGMYRVQISGNDYQPDREAGVHYQIHRGIGIHHAEALEAGEPLRVNVFVGGPPSMTVAAVMPLPEGMPELSFAGLLGQQRIAMTTAANGLPMPAEADFVISGTLDPKRTLPEGPFGDHLGYYSLAHDFPVLNVDAVYHRPGAIWPFTTVGRPPQEDTSFGAFIHELTGALIPDVLPGVVAVHAVDAAGVHPLLLAIGSERYVPYAEQRTPMELLTQAHAILGQGQLSLAKFLWIAAREDAPQLDLHDIESFFLHMLQRVDWRTDLHFDTRTTIDTLDYSGTALNRGSKVVVAAAGAVRRELATLLPQDFKLPEGMKNPRVVLPGILAVECSPASTERGHEDQELQRQLESVPLGHAINNFQLVLVVDDSDFVSRTLNNFLWVAFTRADPAVDIYGVGAFTTCKHWGCHGALVIDARSKPHHAPILEDVPGVEEKVDALGASGGALYGII
ncbi:MAG: 3-octaprenyl-4-hydroxybenzoate carboxy-lyase [Desulfuromonas sp.]|nr:MAG: 3-octaprenyl-4-hydroxybenzoate carboxy-lyase [Desulfuromonas sp.]